MKWLPRFTVGASLLCFSAVSEKKQIRQLVNDELKKRGVPVKDISKIQFERLVATQVTDDGAKTFIGSFVLDSKTAVDRIFLIASIQSPSKLVANLIKHTHSTDREDGKDDEHEGFVDQIDVDGDGTDEVITEVTGYEVEKFQIYRRFGDNWTVVWTGGEGGC